MEYKIITCEYEMIYLIYISYSQVINNNDFEM